jgi:hypothetical protein
LIYASIGTLVNGLNNVYSTILEAAGEFPEMQVVLSVGKNFNPGDLGPSLNSLVKLSTLQFATLLWHCGPESRATALLTGCMGTRNGRYVIHGSFKMIGLSS